MFLSSHEYKDCFSNSLSEFYGGKQSDKSWKKCEHLLFWGEKNPCSVSKLICSSCQNFQKQQQHLHSWRYSDAEDEQNVSIWQKKSSNCVFSLYISASTSFQCFFKMASLILSLGTHLPCRKLMLCNKL